MSRVLILVALLVALIANVSAGLSSTFYQCDSRWGSDAINGSNTICKSGCLMSSVALALYSKGITLKVDGSYRDVNPGVFNKWLKANGGYSGASFSHGVVSKIASHTNTPGVSASYYGNAGSLSANEIKNHLNAGRTLVANVKCKNCHWTAVSHVDGNNNVVVRNPAGASAPTVYSPSSIYQYRIYNIRSAYGGFSMEEEDAFEDAFEDFEEEAEFDEEYMLEDEDFEEEF